MIFLNNIRIDGLRFESRMRSQTTSVFVMWEFASDDDVFYQIVTLGCSRLQLFSLLPVKTVEWDQGSSGIEDGGKNRRSNECDVMFH